MNMSIDKLLNVRLEQTDKAAVTGENEGESETFQQLLSHHQTDKTQRTAKAEPESPSPAEAMTEFSALTGPVTTPASLLVGEHEPDEDEHQDASIENSRESTLDQTALSVPLAAAIAPPDERSLSATVSFTDGVLAVRSADEGGPIAQTLLASTLTDRIAERTRNSQVTSTAKTPARADVNRPLSELSSPLSDKAGTDPLTPAPSLLSAAVPFADFVATTEADDVASLPNVPPPLEDNASSLTALSANASLSVSASQTAPSSVLNSALSQPAYSLAVAQDQPWQQNLSRQLTLFSQNGLQQAEIRLYPEELGSLHVKLQLQNDQLQLQITTSHSHVRALLESAQPYLRTSLSESGVNLGQLDVQTQTGEESSAGAFLANSEHQAKGSERGNQAYPTIATESNDIERPQVINEARGVSIFV